MMFAKLKDSVFLGDFKPIAKQGEYGRFENGEFKGIRYDFIETNDIEKLFSVIPQQYRHNFCLSRMLINTRIEPHTDSDIKTVINFYIKTNKYKTQFYKIKDGITPKTIQVANQTDGFIFQEDELNKTGCFIAKDGEVWVLNVKEPHAIIPTADTNGERIAFSLSTHSYAYPEVIDMLLETGRI